MQTPGPLGDPGVLRDDCSSAPLGSRLVPLSRGAAELPAIGPKGQPAREDWKLCRRAGACHPWIDERRLFAHTLCRVGHNPAALRSAE